MLIIIMILTIVALIGVGTNGHEAMVLRREKKPYAIPACLSVINLVVGLYMFGATIGYVIQHPH